MLFFLNVIYKSFLKLFPSKHTHLVNFVKWWIWCFVVEAFCTKHYLWQYLFRHTWWLKSDITCDWIYLAWTAVQKPVLMFFTKNAFIWIKNSETEKLWNIRGVTIRVSCIERFTGSSKWKWSSLSPWSGDFGVNRARACHYVVVWNALGEGSVISSLSSAGMFPWQRSTVCVSRCHWLNVKCIFIVVSITVANKHTFYILKSF